MNSTRETVALGFRVKSGWAAAVLLGGTSRSPRVCDSFIIDLCDPKMAATRQPYPAAMGKLEANAAKLKARLTIVRRATKRSVAKMLADCRRNNFRIRRAGLVVGSQIDPALIGNPHIRAHALEGQLFRATLVDALRAQGISSSVWSERETYSQAAAKLKRAVGEVRRATQNLGRCAGGPWRAEQKLAAVAAWVSLTG